MKRRDFCKALVCSAALAPGLALPRAEAAAKSQTVGRAVPAGNYTMSFRSELSQMDIEHEYYYSDSFFAHTSVQYDHQLALATLGMVTAAFNTWASDAKYWANGDVGRENSLDAAYTKLGFGDVKYRYYDVDVGKAGDFVGWSTARKTITLNGKRTTIVALILRGGGYGGEWVSNLHTGTGHAHSGFIIPVHEVFADLKNYLAAAQQKGGLGVVKLWMGGYSRGAAVANLLAARVNRELPGLERGNVFVYTFATPVALGPQDYPDLQQDYDNNHNADGSLKESWGESNIFNIISSGDIVPHLLPEEWSFHRNGNDRFLPSTRNEEELEDLNEMGKNDFGPTPLDFSWLATDKETDEVMLRMEEYFISRENYHEKYEAALMDMIQCAFIRSEEEVTQNKVLDDGEVIQRLRTLTHLKNMDYWKISRAVWAGIYHEPCRAQAGRCGEYPHPCAADRRADLGGGSLLWPRERGCEPHCKVHPDVRGNEERARRRHPGGILPPLRELHCSDGILRPLRALHGSHHPHLKTENSETADRCRSRKTPAAVFSCAKFFCTGTQ